MGKSTIYFLSGFNNYYNRTIVEPTIQSPSELDEYIVQTKININFNPGDNVSTQLVVNYSDIDDSTEIDYLIAEDETTNDFTRWFVLDRERNLTGQWTLSLRRDLISDYFEDVISSPLFVEKGWLNTSNKLIYNSENMTYNQIKQSETLLKDETQSAWIVGYLSNDYYTGIASDADGAIYFNRNIERTPSAEASYSELMGLVNLNNGIIYTEAAQNNQDLQFVLQNDSIYYGWLISQQQGWIGQVDNNSVICNERSAVQAQELIRRLQKARRYFIGTQTLDDYISGFRAYNDDLKALNGQYVRNTDSSGPAYFSVNFELQELTTYAVTPPVGSGVYNDVKNTIYNLANSARDNEEYTDLSDDIYFNDANVNTIRIMVPCSKYRLTVTTQPPLLKARTILGKDEATKKRSLIDAPFTMFCMPASNINVISSTDSVEFTSEGNVCREMAAAISEIMGGSTGSSYIYDLQLLPYCPIPNITDSTGRINLTGYQNNTYAYITSEDSQGNYTALGNCGVILFASASSFRKSIAIANPVTVPTDALEFKVDNETKFCRLVSPNYSGAFEFSPTKNGGFTVVEVNCTYKPYSPYIHVNPLFNQGFLYGGDFNDNRGLICGGDFSLPQTTDAWTKFQIENRSYQEAHLRQIENMEVNNAVQREREVWGAVAGSVSGTLTGAGSGAMIGSTFGPIGTAIGAGVGTIAGATSSIIGGIKDLELNDKLRAEGIDFTKDMFGYQLQNIQALPTTMSRTSAFDIDNKLFPFIEFYDCTDTEKQALTEKIRYNGMTVMAIGTINQYTDFNSRYVKGQLVRLLQAGTNNPTGEYHEAVEIAGELMKGVYI